jgi:hypothetical protein
MTLLKPNESQIWELKIAQSSAFIHNVHALIIQHCNRLLSFASTVPRSPSTHQFINLYNDRFKVSFSTFCIFLTFVRYWFTVATRLYKSFKSLLLLLWFDWNSLLSWNIHKHFFWIYSFDFLRWNYLKVVIDGLVAQPSGGDRWIFISLSDCWF